MFDQRARLLRAAVGFVLVPPKEPELRLKPPLARLLARRRRRRHGMNRQGYCLHLPNVDAGTWRATFSRDSMTAAESVAMAAASGHATLHQCSDSRT